MNTTPYILIVEDEQAIADILLDYLHSHGYQTQHFASGKGVIDWLHHHPMDCVLLDIMLPEAAHYGDGLELCKQIRQFSGVPIMMLTARVEEIDRILGLEIGADDYVCKPFSPREVIARVKALLRRASSPNEAAGLTQGWQLDEARNLVHFQGKSCEVSAVEFQILKTLSASPGRIYSRSHLIESIYPDNRLVSDRTVDSHIKKLRQKLQAAFGENDLIQSVYGLGYKFTLPDSSDNS